MVFPNSFDPSWSADGQKIAFTIFTGSTLDIHVRNSDGTNEQTVTSGVGNDRQPAWSPGGSRIAFTATQRPDVTTSCSDLDAELFITDLAGNVTRITTAVGDESEPDWSPDGRKIAFGFGEWTILQEDPFCEVSRDSSDIYTIDPDGTNATSLTDVEGLTGTKP